MKEEEKLAISENLVDTLTNAEGAFNAALEEEADRRLYVSPALTTSELLVLHVLHCSWMATGTPNSASASESVGVTKGHVKDVKKKLRDMGFLNEKDLATSSFGVPAASVVQYVHGGWADARFGALLTSEKLASLKKISRTSYLPLLLTEVRWLTASIRSRAASLGPEKLSLDDALMLVSIADFHRQRDRYPTPRKLSAIVRTRTDLLYQRALLLRKRGLLTRIDFDLTRLGQERAEAFRKEVALWSVDIRARLLDS